MNKTNTTLYSKQPTQKLHFIYNNNIQTTQLTKH